MGLGLVAGPEADHGDLVPAADGDAVRREGPFVDDRVRAVEAGVGVDPREHERMVGRDLPGGEVELLPIDLARIGGLGVFGHSHREFVDARCRQRLLDLPYRELVVLAPGETPVAVEHGLVGHGALRGTVDFYLRYDYGSLPEKSVVVGLQLRVERFQREGRAGGLVGRALAAIGRRAVGGNPLDVDLYLHAAAVAAVEPAARRLGGHGEVGLESFLLDEVLPAEAVAVLLDDGKGEPDRVVAGIGGFLED